MVVYKILNKVNGKFYIGSTSNFFARKAEHFATLRKCCHINWKLQKDFNKYGESAFDMYILHDGFRTREEFFIKEYEIIIKTFANNYNIDKNCPVTIDLKKKKKKRKKKKAVLSKTPDPKKVSWKRVKIKTTKKIPSIPLPSLSSILENKKRREANRQ